MKKVKTLTKSPDDVYDDRSLSRESGRPSACYCLHTNFLRVGEQGGCEINFSELQVGGHRLSHFF